jgi:hypothetical protein
MDMETLGVVGVALVLSYAHTRGCYVNEFFVVGPAAESPCWLDLHLVRKAQGVIVPERAPPPPAYSLCSLRWALYFSILEKH